MKFSFELELELSPAQKRVLRWGVVAGAVVGALGLGVAFAALPTDMTWIQSGKPVKAAALAQNLTDLQQQLTDPTCPPGYTFVPDSNYPSMVDCRNGNDDVVKVGTKATAFWIDRYEASLWSDAAGAGTPYGTPDGAHPYPSTFPTDGQRGASFTPVFAVSKPLVSPSVHMTWFQAVEACAASGKRLPTGEEWLRAASGTVDDVNCNTSNHSALGTGRGDSCVSAWGAHDMIGNVWEWTSDWYATLGTDTTQTGAFTVWPDDNAGGTGADYHQDAVYNVTSAVDFTDGYTNHQKGFPAGALRGGDFDAGTASGVFALFLGRSPTSWGNNIGVRCVIPR